MLINFFAFIGVCTIIWWIIWIYNNIINTREDQKKFENETKLHLNAVGERIRNLEEQIAETVVKN